MTANSYIIESGGGPSVMVRLDDRGEPEETESDQLPYDPVPPDQYDLEITGFQAPFEMPRSAQHMKPGMSPTVTKTRLEFTVLDGPQSGKRFLGMYTWSLHEKSGLGILIRAVKQQPIPPRVEVPSVLGLTFHAYVTHAKDPNTGQTKLGRDGHPFPDVVATTVKPLAGHPTAPTAPPTPLSAAKPAAPALDRDRPNASANEDPRASWSGFWRFARSYGFTGIDSVATELNRDLDGLDSAAVYDLLAAHIGHEN